MTDTTTPTIEKNGDVTFLVFGPEYENLDDTALQNARDTIIQVADAADPPLVVIDLSQTSFFGSAFLAVLFRGWKRLCARDGGKFALCGLTPSCETVIKSLKLNDLWEIYKTREAAIAALVGE